MLVSVGTVIIPVNGYRLVGRTDGILVGLSVLTSQQTRMARAATGVVAMPLFGPVLRLGGDGSTRREAGGSPRSPLFPCRGVFPEFIRWPDRWVVVGGTGNINCGSNSRRVVE